MFVLYENSNLLRFFLELSLLFIPNHLINDIHYKANSNIKIRVFVKIVQICWEIVVFDALKEAKLSNCVIFQEFSQFALHV